MPLGHDLHVSFCDGVAIHICKTEIVFQHSPFTFLVCSTTEGAVSHASMMTDEHEEFQPQNTSVEHGEAFPGGGTITPYGWKTSPSKPLISLPGEKLNFLAMSLRSL